MDSRRLSREVYKYGHLEGWRKCFTLWQLGELDLAEVTEPRELPKNPTSTDILWRANDDGFEACRQLLLSGNASP